MPLDYLYCELRILCGSVGQSPRLPSFRDPADQRSGGETDRKRCRDGQHQMPFDALGGVIQEFFGRVAALFRGTSYNSYAFLYRVGDRAAHARSLMSRFRDVFRCSFHYAW
jgi:hypothetical protein